METDLKVSFQAAVRNATATTHSHVTQINDATYAQSHTKNAKKTQRRKDRIGCVRYLFFSGEATGGGFGGLNPPLSSGATHEICAEPMRRYWGTPHA